ncbi:MAG: hypothetical protein U9N33_03810 [Campylobacterota bacterium]|nr:hypothetical protein [Campylobacterota bacterium]
MKKNITALSFTPKYDELEDRIRLSINYDDIQNRVDLMITRGFVLKLFPILDEYMLKFYNIDLTTSNDIDMNAPAKEKVKNNNATSLTDGANLELYHQEDELLIEVNFSYTKATRLSIIKFRSKSSEVTAQLNATSMKQVFTMIKSSIPFFSWGISHNL